MKNILLFKTLVFVTIFSYGQRQLPFARQQWSETFEKPEQAEFIKTFVLSNDEFITIRKDDELLVFQRYTSDMKLLDTKKIDYRHIKEGKLYYKGFLWLGDNIYIISTHRNEDADEYDIYAQGVTTHGFDLLSPARLSSAEFMKGGVHEDFGLSHDRSKMFLVHYVKGKEPKEKFVHVKVYSKNLELLWERTFDHSEFETMMDEGEKSMSMSFGNMSVDDNGDLYFLSRVRLEKNKERKDKPMYYYKLVMVTNDGDKIKEYDIDMGDKFITNIYAETNADNIYIAGFYSDRYSSGAAGSFLIRGTIRTQKFEDPALSEFEHSFVTHYWAKKRTKKADKKLEKKGEKAEFDPYYVDDIVIGDDGNIFVISEIYYVIARTYYTKTGSYTVYYYYYSNILVNAYDKKMELLWNSQIPKWQVSKNEGGFFASYHQTYVNGKLYFVFNDNCQNAVLEKTNPKKRKAYGFNGYGSNTCVFIAELDEDGKVTKEPLYTIDDIGMYTRIKVTKTFPDGDFIMFARKKKEYKFVRISF
ncbi:MAG: hypothetical protein KJ607_05480 [Bacteroidetes bacterium]|nr:hypothetical protein [Bacteroidota bacterium]